MTTKLVTAIYTDIKEYPFYGHVVLSRQERYLHSLRTLNNMDVPIVCFHNDTQTKLLQEHCQKFKLSNVTLKVSNLKDYPLAARMKEIKDATGSYKFYHEVGWNKFNLLKQELDQSFDYTYWIDAGLSHAGLFLEKYNPFASKMDGMSRTYENYSFTGVFNPLLFERINSWVGNKLASLQYNGLSHDVSHLYSILKPSAPYNKTMIGGLIGGKTEKLEWFISEFESAAIKVLEANVIMNHESIMAHLVKEAPENFKEFVFDTWYHDDYCKGSSFFNRDCIKNKTHFVHFFERVLGI